MNISILVKQLKQYQFWLIGLSILLGLILLLLFFISSKGQFIQKIDQPIPTLTQSNPTKSDVSLTPASDDKNIGFTGYKEDEYTVEEISQINQINELRESSPYDGISFVVSYNYTDYIFDVSLGTPREKALEQFRSWKELSFPSIPDDQFRFVN